MVMSNSSAITRVGRFIGSDHGLVALTYGKQLVLGHDVLALIFHVVLMDSRLDDRIHWAGLFAETTENALEQIDVVASRAARPVGRDIRLDRDSECRAHGFAQLAGDATLLPVRI